jgi:Holliday junction DNA helicase RuvA
MIAFVRGPVAAVFVDSAVVDVGGVGIQVMCSPGTIAGLRIGDEATLATSLVVREDSLTLFGFTDHDERLLFEMLQTATGVGPKLAQAMLAVHRPDELRGAIMREDLAALCKVPGVGRKGAQRIVLELKDRIASAPEIADGRATRGAAPDQAWQDAVRAGLLGLGWSAREADAALESVAPLADDAVASGSPLSTAELLRAALRSLSKA